MARLGKRLPWPNRKPLSQTTLTGDNQPRNRGCRTCRARAPRPARAARLDRRGQIWFGPYNCSERGLERRPQGSEADWLDEPLWMLGPGPTY
jgi:hypothetical protein